MEGISLTEGAVVAVVTRGGDERSFSLTEAQENELLAAMAEIERGEYVTLEQLRAPQARAGSLPRRLPRGRRPIVTGAQARRALETALAVVKAIKPV